jgi:hypothetical protein
MFGFDFRQGQPGDLLRAIFGNVTEPSYLTRPGVDPDVIGMRDGIREDVPIIVEIEEAALLASSL